MFDRFTALGVPPEWSNLHRIRPGSYCLDHFDDQHIPTACSGDCHQAKRHHGGEQSGTRRAPRGSFFDGIPFEDRTYGNSNISGITFRTSWADVEPAQGDFEWTKLDTVFDNAEKNGKWVELVLIPGFGTPAWALQGVQTGSFSIIYGPGKGENLMLPLPWDEIYLNRWFSFLKS